MLDLCFKIDYWLAQCWLCIILYIGPTLARHYMCRFFIAGVGVGVGVGLCFFFIYPIVEFSAVFLL